MATIYQLRIGGVNGKGNFSENILHFQSSEASTFSKLAYANEIITAWLANIQAAFLACLGNDYVVNIIDCKAVNGGGGPTANQIVNGAGGFGSGSSSSALAANLVIFTAAPNNRQGHVYIPGVPTSGIDSDVLQTDYVSVLNDLGALLIVPMTGAHGSNITYGVYTRKTDSFHAALTWDVRSKVTAFNQRLRPVV